MAITRTTVSNRFLLPTSTQKSLAFNGTSDSATIPITPATSGFCFGMWIKINTLTASMRILDYQDAGPSNGFTLVYDAALPSKLSFKVNDGSDKSAVTDPIPTNRWIHIIGTYKAGSNSDFQIYVNNVVGTKTGTLTTMIAPSQTLTLAKRANAASNFATIQIENFTFQNTTTVWTDSQRTELLYRNTIPDGAIQYTMNDTVADQNGLNALTVTGTSYSTDAPLQPRSLSTNRMPDYNYGTSLFFNSTYITVPVVPATTGFSVAFWFYRRKIGNNERLVDCTDSSTQNGFVIFQGAGGNNNKILINILNGASSTVLLAPVVEVGKWYHVVFTFEPNNAKAYLNGVLYSGDTSCSMSTPASTLTIGRSSGAGVTPFDSYMDEFVFKNGTSFTQTEITDLYYKNTIPTGATVRYDFNNTPFDTILDDRTGNGNDGTLTIGNGEFSTFVPRPVRSSPTFSLLPDNAYDVIIIAGQSNASGRVLSNQRYSHPYLMAAMLGNDYVYKELTDPTDSSTGQIDTVSSDTASGSVWPLLATLIMQKTNKPVLFVPCALGSTQITQWLPGSDHQDRSTLYGSMIYRALQASTVGTLKGVVWWQGESDAVAGMSQATYNGHLDTIANAIQTDLGVKMMPCLFQNNSGITDANENAIRAAISEAYSDNTNVLTGPDLSDLASDDSFHFTTNSKIYTAASRWWNAINNVFF